jgi:hypothetical protein
VAWMDMLFFRVKIVLTHGIQFSPSRANHFSLFQHHVGKCIKQPCTKQKEEKF